MSTAVDTVIKNISYAWTVELEDFDDKIKNLEHLQDTTTRTLEVLVVIVCILGLLLTALKVWP